MISCEVVVAGGGSAGISAAIAAARAGAKTLLIERGGMLGGMGSSAFVHTICGLYEIRDAPRAIFANEGFPPEFAKRLIGAGAAKAALRMGRLDVLPHDPVMLAVVADQLVSETPNLRVWLHTELIAANGKPDHLEDVELICRGRRECVSAGAFIDATGDASLVSLAGAAFSQCEASLLQRPAYVALLRGLDANFLDGDGRLQLAHVMASAVKAGELPPAALGAAFRSAVSPNEAFLTIDLAGDSENGELWDPLSPDQLSNVEFCGRATALAIVRYLSERLPSAKESRIVAWPARAGVRESRRATGVCELTKDEFLKGAAFDDGVASTSWPMELRERATGPRWQFPESPRSAQIPLRSLRHRDVENLWIAGRCISASHEAQASIRVIGTCLATGEAAGIAAAEDLASRESNWQAAAERLIKRRQNFPRSC